MIQVDSIETHDPCSIVYVSYPHIGYRGEVEMRRKPGCTVSVTSQTLWRLLAQVITDYMYRVPAAWRVERPRISGRKHNVIVRRKQWSCPHFLRI